VIAGGDTGASIENLGLKDKLILSARGEGDVGILTKGKLPAWE